MQSVTRDVFPNEKSLVDEFLGILESTESPWGKVDYITEHNYQRGRPDVVATRNSKEVLSFEAKLVKWRDALQQAYRNTCFAHRSFVVLPGVIAYRVATYEREFQRRGVGLCAVVGGNVTVLIAAPLQSPLQPRLTEEFAHVIRSKTNASDARS